MHNVIIPIRLRRISLVKYKEIFFFQKQNLKISLGKKFDFLNIFFQGGSNKYPQSMFWIENKKNRYSPASLIYFYIKVGYDGYTFHGHVFLV